MRRAAQDGIRGVGIASTGNAAISLSAYAYINGLRCHVFLPRGIARDRLIQIQAYSPTITLCNTYDEAITECESTSDREGFLNCNPGARIEKLIGDSGIGREIAKKKKWAYVVCPTNNGTLLAGVWQGLKAAGARTRMIASATEQTRVAEGIAGFHRFEQRAMSQALKESNGDVVMVTDEDISDAARLLISDGLIVEGAAAAAVAALKYIHHTRSSNVCGVITGTGLKFPRSVKELLRDAAA